MQVKIENEHVIITLPIEEKASTTGKSILIASTGGFQKADVKYKDKTVSVSVNVSIPNK